MKNFRRVVREAREQHERLTTTPSDDKHAKLVARLMAIPKEEIISAINNRNPWDFERFVTNLEFEWNHKQTRALLAESEREMAEWEEWQRKHGDIKDLRGFAAAAWIKEMRAHMDRQQALDKKIDKLMGIGKYVPQKGGS